MRILFLLTCSLLLSCVLGCAKEGAPLADGGSFDLGAKEWLVVNYWAEWCGPCRHEIPELNDLHAGDQDVPVTVLGVNYDGLRDAKLLEVLQRMGIEFPVLVDDPRGRWQQPLPNVLPSTLLIAPDGSLIETLQGPQTRAGILGRIEVAASANSRL